MQKPLALALLSAAGFVAPALAQDPAAAAPDPAKVTVNGFASAAFSYNDNKPPADADGDRFNQLRVFDFQDRKLKLDVAELVVQRTTPSPGDFGFRVDLTAGQSIPKLTAANGLFRDEQTGEPEDFDLQQAFVTWVAPVGTGLKIDAGKWVTLAGAELIEGYDGFNDHYSRSILFGYAIPFTHTGAKVSYNFGKVAVTAMGMQGWDNFKDNNGAKTFGGQLALTPSSQFSAYATFLTGAEQTDNDDDKRRLVDLIGVWKPTSSVALTVNYDWAKEGGLGFGDRDGGRDAEWSGIAASLKFTLSPSSRWPCAGSGSTTRTASAPARRKSSRSSRSPPSSASASTWCFAGTCGATRRTSSCSRARTARRTRRRRSRST